MQNRQLNAKNVNCFYVNRMLHFVFKYIIVYIIVIANTVSDCKMCYLDTVVFIVTETKVKNCGALS